MKRGRPKKKEHQEIAAPIPITMEKVPAPEHLKPDEKLVFERLVNVLQGMNIYSIGDCDLVASYAEVYCLGAKHKKELDKGNATFTTEKKYEGLSPNYLIWRDCQKSGQKILSDLGLTPASRTRVAAIVKEEVNELQEFLRKRED